MWIALNGPEVAHCSGIVKEAMKSYWEDSKDEKNRKGHFIRRSENIISYTVSEAVDSIVKKPVKAPFLL